MKARLAIQNGTRAWLRAYWTVPDNGPRKIHGSEHGYHDVQVALADTDDLRVAESLDAQHALWGRVEDYPRERFGTACETCGEARPAWAMLQVFVRRRYDTPSGRLEPGCLYWAPWYHHRVDDAGVVRGCWMWENCADPRGHLLAVLPNGHEWDIDSRASNCDLKDERLHRCWVRHGEPPDVHVDKAGRTCGAGAGSIAVPGYHGFLHGGAFTA